jgi:hypothetical protein
MNKILAKACFILLFVASCHLLACGGGSQSGIGGEGVTAGNSGTELVAGNFAAPTQASGTLSPGVDLEPGPTVYYKAQFGKGDLAIEEQGVFLKGVIEKWRNDAPNMEGFVLKLIDRRSQKFLWVPVTVKPDNVSEADFSIFLKAPAFDLDELLSGQTISLFLSPRPQDAKAVSVAEMADCENPVCVDSDWFMVPFKSDAAAPKKPTPFIPNDNPAPSGHPPNSLERPPGTIKMPGK